MNVDIGIEAAQFLEKEYINGIFLAVQQAGQKIVLGRLSLSILSLVIPPHPYLVVTCEEWCCYSRRGWFVLAPIEPEPEVMKRTVFSLGE
jgi:hypothetical protein